MITFKHLPHIRYDILIDFKRNLRRAQRDDGNGRDLVITEGMEAFGFKGAALEQFLKGHPIEVDGVKTLHIPDLGITQSADRDTLGVKEAFDVYEVLINYAGARSNLSEVISFVSSLCTDECSEYRFQGDFGFGGKFRNGNTDTYYIDYYPENQTDALDDQEARCNTELTKLAIHYKKPERFADRSLDADRAILNAIEVALEQDMPFPESAPLDYLTMTWLVNAAGYPEGWRRMFSHHHTFDQAGLKADLLALVREAKARCVAWERPTPEWERCSA